MSIVTRAARAICRVAFAAFYRRCGCGGRIEASRLAADTGPATTHKFVASARRDFAGFDFAGFWRASRARG